MGPAAWALIKYMNPSADIISQSTSVVDLTDATIGPGSAGLSSAGRAPDLHSGGQGFDPPSLHHLPRVTPSQ